MTTRKSSTWKTRAMEAITRKLNEDNKVRSATRGALNGLEVAAHAAQVYADKMDEFTADLRKARNVLVAGLAAAHLEASVAFEESPKLSPETHDEV